jgi:acyl carrier protein
MWPAGWSEESVMVDVADGVIEIIAKQAKVAPETLTRETVLGDLGIESFDTIEIVFALEEKFDIEVPFNANADDKTAASFNSVGDVTDAVQKIVDARDAKAR